jgi:hypothetical protein
MTYRRSGSLWSLLRAIFTARAAGRSRRRHPGCERGRVVRRALRRWLR